MRILNKEVLDEFMDKHADTITPVNKWIEIVENNDFIKPQRPEELVSECGLCGQQPVCFQYKGEPIPIPCADSFYQRDNADQVLWDPRRI